MVIRSLSDALPAPDAQLLADFHGLVVANLRDRGTDVSSQVVSALHPNHQQYMTSSICILLVILCGYSSGAAIRISEVVVTLSNL